MQIRAYTVVERAIEEGVAYAITRLFKYDSTPMGEDQLRERSGEVVDHIMTELCEVVEFSNEDLGVKDE